MGGVVGPGPVDGGGEVVLLRAAREEQVRGARRHDAVAVLQRLEGGPDGGRVLLHDLGAGPGDAAGGVVAAGGLAQPRGHREAELVDLGGVPAEGDLALHVGVLVPVVVHVAVRGIGVAQVGAAPALVVGETGR